MGELNANATLHKARYFLAQAREADADPKILSDRLPFGANLEAAIIYARSSLDHLHTEFARKHHDKGYRTWHTNKFDALKSSSPVFNYLIQRRDFIVHQEAQKTTAQVSAEVKISTASSVSLAFTVTRADGTVEKEASSEPTQKNVESPLGRTSQAFFFADADWRAKPAVAYIDEFIDVCGSFISEAESKFQ